MDDDHRQFLVLLKILNDAEDAEFPSHSRNWWTTFDCTFIREGRLMRLEKFPALGEHEGEHHRVLGELLQFNRTVKRGRLPLARAYVRVGIPEWFKLHLSTMDTALAVWCMSRHGESE